MKIIQDKKEYDIRRVVGKRVKLKYNLKKTEVLVAGYCKHKRLPIFLYIIEPRNNHCVIFEFFN